VTFHVSNVIFLQPIALSVLLIKFLILEFAEQLVQQELTKMQLISAELAIQTVHLVLQPLHVKLVNLEDSFIISNVTQSALRLSLEIVHRYFKNK
jgi:hypothetical protein